MCAQAANNKESRWLNGIIAVEIVLYVVLTTAIFVLHKKIALQEQEAGEIKTATPDAPAPLTAPVVRPDEPVTPQTSEETEKRAALSHQRGNIGDAIAEYRKLLAAQPHNAELHLTLGQLYLSDRRYAKEAREHLEKVLSIAPDHPRRRIIEMWVQGLAEKNTPAEKAERRKKD